MRVLITGGLGYIGGRLAQYFYHLGYQVVLSSRRAYNQGPVWLPEAEMVKVDWGSDLSLEKIVSNVDVIIHTAGMNAQDCSSDPVAAMRFNGLSTARLISAAEKRSVKKFIYISTAHVYSAPLNGAITEKSCVNNLHPYAASHKAAEDAVLWANSQGKINGIVFRLSNAVGPAVEKNVNCWMLLTNDLCRQAIVDKKIQLNSDGTQQRDFIAISAITKTIEYFVKNDINSLHSLFNLGGGISHSVIEIAKIVQDRYSRRFGEVIQIKKNLNIKQKNVGQLDYKIDLLKDTGIVFNNDLVGEIDNLLEFCDKNFSLN